jgi:hypothetical protein
VCLLPPTIVEKSESLMVFPDPPPINELLLSSKMLDLPPTTTPNSVSASPAILFKYPPPMNE